MSATKTVADVRRIATHKCVARKVAKYRPTPLLSLFDKLCWQSPLILKGPKGTGKTISIEQWAHSRNHPFVRKSCTAETGDRQLLGAQTLKSFTESYFVLGCLSTAIDIANETGRCVLVLEEINALNEEAQKVVNSIADYRREVDLHTIGEVYRLRDEVLAPWDGEVLSVSPDGEYGTNVVFVEKSPASGEPRVLDITVPTWLVHKRVTEGAQVREKQVLVGPARLWVLGTMNQGYGGTYDLNEDFRSRFQFIEVGYLPDAEEEAILFGAFPNGTPTAEEKLFVSRLMQLGKETRGQKLGYALSTRDLEQCVEALVALGSPAAALKLLEGKFDAQYTTDFRARTKSTFSIDISTTDFSK